MRISRVDCFIVRLGYKPIYPRQTSKEGEFNAARSLHPTLDSLILRLETDNGIVGWGEAFGHACNPATMSLLTERLAPFLKGENCEDIAALMEKAHYAFHSYGRGGTMMYALSALDIALWDIRAKAHQRPLWQLLGGTRSHIELYPSLGSFDGDLEKLLPYVQNLTQQGYRHIKLHERDPKATAAVRRAMLEDGALMLDTNCAWGEDEARENLAQLRDAGVAFVEEPTFPPEALSRLKRLKQQTGMPLAAGENMNNSEEFRQCIELGLVDVMQPSVAKIGGISAVLEIIDAWKANPHGTILPHCFYYGPGLLATAHLLSVMPETVPLEVPWLEFEQKLHPFMQWSPVVDLPVVPGLGFSPDPAILDRYTIARG
ncbi:hypothetical protein B2M27_03210 [Kluyvera intermedia]|uniref:Mandelate racemase/muconate lactonizing enzyme C-terminal domain-containing protein n=1 Tax=Kluyvera intermedia TaxID=61648 RepID=A0ABX3UKA3_KLUIN|nr:mandelate racemase/muconate lactonizing enzyme family protein [Kluyvera intermedia]ORJ51832.1 hypothetical protein B2M27_03210 [Kluyvera intermedia]